MIYWDSSYSTGILEVDRQHKILIDLINQFQDADKLSDEFLELAFKQTIAYVSYHFEYEERLMIAADILDFSHVTAHRTLTKTIADFAASVQSQGLRKMSPLIALTLGTWLVRHILVVDKEMAVHLLTKGMLNQSMHPTHFTDPTSASKSTPN